MKSVLLFLSITLCSTLGYAQDCASITITGGTGQITVSGLSGAPIATVQVFNSSWASVFNQSYTNPANSVVVSPLPAGQYTVNVRLSQANWANICEKSGNATVTTGPPPTADTCGATFFRTIGTAAGNEESFGIVKSSDGGFFVAGHASVTGTTNHDGLVMKFDSKMNLLWSKTIGGAPGEIVSQITRTGDGGCVVAGAANFDGIGTYSGDCWLVRMDASGNVLWQKRYFVSGTSGSLSAIMTTSDGGFAFSGTFPNTPGLADWMVVKVDANGNILWQKRLGSGNSDSGNGMVEDEHGGNGIVVAGVYYGTTLYDQVLTKLDLVTGNVMWTKTYDFDSRGGWWGPIEKVADGFVLNKLAMDGWAFENGTPGIVKTDFSGNIIWAKDFKAPNCREGRTVALPDGGMMMVQSEFPHDGASDIHLLRISSTGNIIWAKKYPRAGMQWLWHLIVDGNYVVGTGSATNGSYSDALIARIDLNGKIGSCASENVTPTTRNCVVTPINFNWPTNTSPGFTAANTTFTTTDRTFVESAFCPDACLNVTISSPTVNENAGNAVLQVCLAAPAATNLAYNYTTSNGTATSGSDYTGGAGVVTILAGQTCGTITIPITNDSEVESAENFTVSIGSVTGTVTINDDDQAQNNCSSVTFTPGNNLIIVSGVVAPVATVQVFNSSWATVFNQTYTNSPGTVNVPIAPGTYLVKVTFYNSNWGYICDKSDNVTVVNNCPAGTICISNICPSTTVNLNDAYSVANLPAGTTVSWHTGTPATDANRMTDQQAQNVSVSGTYYAAINIAGAGCYSATVSVTVTIVACSGTEITSSTLIEGKNVVQLKSADQPTARSIMAFPNPFTRSLRVVIDSEKKEKAMLTLTDLQGRQLKQVPVQLVPGSNTVLVDGLDQFPSGNYFLKISSTNGVKTLKVMRQQ